MGLHCTKSQYTSGRTSFLETDDSWTRKGGFLFRPGFRNELDESVYANSQRQYLIQWRRIHRSTFHSRNKSTGSYIDVELSSQWKQYIRAYSLLRGIPDSLCRDILLKLFQIELSDNYWKLIKESFEVIHI